MNRDLKAFLILTGTALVLSIGAFVGLAHGSEDLECEGATHCVLMLFPRHVSDKDEPGADRWERLKRIADGVDAATAKRVERAWLIQTAWHESRLARYVDLDQPRCRDGEKGVCDGGKAATVFQLHNTRRNLSKKEAAARASTVFRRAGNYCRSEGEDYFLGGTAHYARGGRHCTWADAEKRVALMWKISWRLGQ